MVVTFGVRHCHFPKCFIFLLRKFLHFLSLGWEKSIQRGFIPDNFHVRLQYFDFILLCFKCIVSTCRHFYNILWGSSYIKTNCISCDRAGRKVDKEVSFLINFLSDCNILIWLAYLSYALQWIMLGHFLKFPVGKFLHTYKHQLLFFW